MTFKTPMPVLLLSRFMFMAMLLLSSLIRAEADHFAPTGNLVESMNAPDFSAIESQSERQRRFKAYFRPIIEQVNNGVQTDREALLKLSKKPDLSDQDFEFLERTGEAYGLPLDRHASLDQYLNRLLKRVEQIPVSLALSQAAIESGWGTSRFAIEGNNYFGQWCYRKGCGLVPGSRPKGETYEVRVFDSAHASVQAYFMNLNRHRAYRSFRALRVAANNAGVPVSACNLAEGLGAYSQMGQGYVRLLKSFMKSHFLDARKDIHCS